MTERERELRLTAQQWAVAVRSQPTDEQAAQYMYTRFEMLVSNASEKIYVRVQQEQARLQTENQWLRSTLDQIRETLTSFDPDGDDALYDREDAVNKVILLIGDGEPPEKELGLP